MTATTNKDQTGQSRDTHMRGLTIHGQPQRDAGTPRIYQVFTNCILTTPERGEATDCVALHEIPLRRRLIAPYGGSLRMLPGWPPSLESSRIRGMTEMRCEEHLDYLRETYLDARGDVPVNHFEDVYGRGRNMVLWQVMARIYKAYLELDAKSKAEGRQVTEYDLEQLVQIAEPETDQLDEIGLLPPPPAEGEVDALVKPKRRGRKPKAEGDQGAPGEPDYGDAGAPASDAGLVAYLSALDPGPRTDTIQTFAAAVARYGADIPEEGWATVAHVGGHQQKRDGLLRHLQAYQAQARGEGTLQES